MDWGWFRLRVNDMIEWGWLRVNGMVGLGGG